MGLAEIFWLIAVIASFVAAAAMAVPILFFKNCVRWASRSSGVHFYSKGFILTKAGEKTLAIINHLFAFAMVSSIAYLLFLLFNASLGAFPVIAVLFQCLFLIVFRGTGLAGQMQSQFIENNPSQGYISGFLSRNIFSIVILALLHLGSLVSLVCSGIGCDLGGE